MNTPVSLPIAKLLKEKGFDIPTFGFYSYSSNKYNTYYKLIRVNLLSDNYAAPTIVDVVMWIYEKHKIWISVDMIYETSQIGFWYCIRQSKEDDKAIDSNEYPTPQKAYESAIEYTLNNLI